MAYASMLGLLQHQLPAVGLAKECWADPVRSIYPDRHSPPDIKPPQSL